MIAILALALVPSSVDSIPALKDKWIRVVTPHFVVVSNAKEKTARRVGIALERFHAAVGSRAADEQAEAFVPTTIVAFADDESFRPYKLEPDGTPAFYVGVFAPSPDGNFIGLNLDPDEDPYGTVYHEYVHWMNSRRHVETPLWYDEGMAEYYSTFRVEEDEIHIGLPVENHLLLLTLEPLLSFAFLFDATGPAMDSEVKDTRDEEERRGIFYAESWALYHYLTLGRPDLRPKLFRFLELWIGSVNPNAAWQEAFGVDYEPVERDLREYVRGERYPYQRIKVGELSSIDVRIDPMDYAELLRCLGEYVAHVTPWQKQEALRHLEAAVESDPSNARAWVGLACLFAKMGRRSDAEEHFRKALELAPEDDEVLYRWGSTLVALQLQANPHVKPRPDPLPAELRTARELLDRAIQLNPRRAEAYVDYGTTYLYDPGDVKDGIGALEVARSYMPSRMDVVQDLVALYARSGDRNTAVGLADHVLARSRNPEWLQNARQFLQMHAEETNERRQGNLYYDAVDRYNAQDFNGAILLLDRLAPAAEDPELIEAIRDLRQKSEEALRQQHEIVRPQYEIDEYHRQVATYNEAIVKGRAGDFKGAAKILEELLPKVKDPKLAARVRETLEDARRRAGS